MHIKDTLIGNKLSIDIDGHVTGIKEFTEIKSMIESYKEAQIIDLKFNDAHVIPSMIIGYLVKIIKKDNKRVDIKCSQKELKQLMIDLNLHTMMNVS